MAATIWHAYCCPYGHHHHDVLSLAALGALVVALVTAGTQTIRAASANPVDSLRCE